MRRIIHYDLNSKLKDPSYEDVKKVLEELNYKMITESVYWIDTALSKKQIFQKLGEVIHKSDDVYYVSVDSDTHKLFCEPIPSLK